MQNLLKKIGVFMILLSSLILVSCWSKKVTWDKNKNNDVSNVNNWWWKTSRSNFVIPEEVKNKAEDDFSLIKKKWLDPQVIDDAIFIWSWYHWIWEFYRKLASRTQYNVVAWKKIEDIIDTTKWKERKIKVSVVDYDWKPLEWIKIYLWWWLLWKTDKNGKLVKKIKIPRVYDYMYFQAYNENYLPGHKRLNAMYIDWRLILVSFVLKKAKVYTVDPSNINIGNNLISVKIKWDCVLKKWDGSCYKWKAKMSIAYVKPEEIDNLNLIRQGKYKWKIIYLMSNWMAFIEFYDENWNRLLYNENNKWKICYKVWKKAIEQRNALNRTKIFNETDWYWRFDKSNWLRNFGGKDIITVDKNKWLFCYETSHIY